METAESPRPKRMTAFGWALTGYVVGLAFWFMLISDPSWFLRQANTPVARAVMRGLGGDDAAVGVDVTEPLRRTGQDKDAYQEAARRRRLADLRRNLAVQQLHRYGSVALVALLVAGLVVWAMLYRRDVLAPAVVETRQPAAGAGWMVRAGIIWVLGIAAFMMGLPRPGAPQSPFSYVPLAITCVFIFPWAWMRIYALIVRGETTPRVEIYVAAILPLLLQLKITVGYVSRMVEQHLGRM